MPAKKFFGGRAFPVTFIQQVAAGSLITSIGVIAAPPALGEMYEFVGADYSFDVTSSSGTLDIRNVPASTAFTGGSSMLSSTASLSATARVARKVTVTSTAANRFIKPGNTVSIVLGGSLTGLAGFSVTIWLNAMRNIRTR